MGGPDLLDSREVSAIAGVDPATLRYWVRVGLALPAAQLRPGTRAPHGYDEREVRILRLLAPFAEVAPLRVQRRVAKFLRAWAGPLEDVPAFLVCDADGVACTDALKDEYLTKPVWVLPTSSLRAPAEPPPPPPPPPRSRRRIVIVPEEDQLTLL